MWQFLAIVFAVTTAFSSSASAADCSIDRFKPGSQAEIDTFQSTYGPCDTLNGDLDIAGLEDVTNLDGLEGLETVKGYLRLLNNPQLIDTRGLFFLTEVGGALIIDSNPVIEEFFGGNLASVGALILSNNASMDRFTGLNTLTAAGEVTITDNPAMSSLIGLYELRAVESILLARNPLIRHLEDLGSLAATGYLTIMEMDGLTNLRGLWSLTTAHSIYIASNQNLASVEGLRNVVVTRYIHIESNPALEHLFGLANFLSSPPDLPRIILINNGSLQRIDTFENLVAANQINIRGNSSLQDLDDFPSLTRIVGSLSVEGNTALESIPGMDQLEFVGESVRIMDNPLLATCHGLLRALDYLDDGEPGPGPGPAGIPDVGGDVLMGNNLAGCNSVSDLLADFPLDHINAGISDAWYDPDTNGQGFQIMVFPIIRQIFLTWFTFDTERPPPGTEAYLGEPGHRWLTAQGPYQGTEAVLDIWISEGGIFDSGVPAPSLRMDGQMTLEFTTCNHGLITFDIPSIDRQGALPIQRITLDNVALCAELNVREMTRQARFDR